MKRKRKRKLFDFNQKQTKSILFVFIWSKRRDSTAHGPTRKHSCVWYRPQLKLADDRTQNRKARHSPPCNDAKPNFDAHDAAQMTSFAYRHGILCSNCIQIVQFPYRFPRCRRRCIEFQFETIHNHSAFGVAWLPRIFCHFDRHTRNKLTTTKVIINRIIVIASRQRSMIGPQCLRWSSWTEFVAIDDLLLTLLSFRLSFLNIRCANGNAEVPSKQRHRPNKTQANKST